MGRIIRMSDIPRPKQKWEKELFYLEVYLNDMLPGESRELLPELKRRIIEIRDAVNERIIELKGEK